MKTVNTKNMKLIIRYILLLVFIACFSDESKAERGSSQVGFSRSYPVSYADWPNGFMGGNGKMGIIVFGNPLDETVIFNDRKFFMAASRERSFNRVSSADLEQIRDYCVTENWEAANKLANEVHGWKDGGEGNKHPGFAMYIKMHEDGAVTNYSRSCNYKTGEITVKWTDNRGDWERRSFVSRKYNVVVQYLLAPKGEKLNCSVRLGADDGMHFPTDMVFTNASTPDFLNLRVNYSPKAGTAGYEGVVKVIAKGGTKSIENGHLIIKNTDGLLLLSRTEKYYENCENEWNKKDLQEQLDAIPDNYKTLLKGQEEMHQAIFDRVALDLDAGSDRALSNEELLAKQKTSPVAVKALWERLFYAGRYHYLSSSSELNPPDLLGLWTGDCNVGWSGFYHLDANLNLQVGGGNIGNMPEVMEGYFALMERLIPGFEINASKLLGCRGMLGGGNTAGLNGLISALNFHYPYHYVTGEMGWLLYPFWEHYLISGDVDFLRKRLYPMLKEMGYFYEDFLVEKDKNGKYIFAGSISPENQPGGLGFSLVNNSTFDIAGAKFCLTTLIEASHILGEDLGNEGVKKWQAILDQLPPYLVNSDGALNEWSWSGLKEHYNHRHSSHLITVWPFREITPETSSLLFSAAQTALNKRDQYNYENAGHGLLHAALIAAGLNDAGSLNKKLLRLTREDFFYNSLSSSHYVNHGVFCTDVCNTFPTIIMEMLVSSHPGTLEFLPALPQELSKGSINGLKARSRLTVNELHWNMTKNTVTCELQSDIDQQITLIERQGIQEISSSVEIDKSPIGEIARIIYLKKGEIARVSLRLKSE